MTTVTADAEATDELLPYFAYGSNLDVARLMSRCPGARPALGGTAVSLHGYRLRFDGHGVGVAGAAANVVPDPAAAVPGQLWALTASDWPRLDRAESVGPGLYWRRRITVRDAGGAEVEALLYEKPPGRDLPAPPGHRYLGYITGGYDRLGIDRAPVDAALAESTGRGPCTRLFVYGTLMRGDRNHGHLTGARFDGVGVTADPFRLLDLGAYPGLAPRPPPITGAGSQIEGEVFAITGDMLAALDRFEGHAYRRVSIALSDGSHVWTYQLASLPAAPVSVIESGAWRRRGIR